MRRQRHSWSVAGIALVLGSALVAATPSAAQPSTAPPTTTQPSTSGSAPMRPATTVTAVRDGRIAAADANADQIVTLNPDGSHLLVVSPPGDRSLHPAWAPDGSRLVFASNHAGGDDTRLFTVKPDGTDLRQVTHDSAGSSHFTPAYTRDGTRIVFSRCRPDPPGGCALQSVRTDGTHRRQLTAYGADRADLFPALSPGGGRIAFSRFGDRGILAQVWVMRSDGSHPHPVTTPSLEAAAPAWTNDGRHLLVTNNWQHLGENVVRIGDDGSHPVMLTHRRFPHNAVQPALSPTGSRIAYSDDQAFPGVIGADLFLMRLDGSGKHAISTGGRLLDADWGTAPLLTGPVAQSRFGLASPTAPRQALSMPHWIAPRTAAPTPAHRWGQ